MTKTHRMKSDPYWPCFENEGVPAPAGTFALAAAHREHERLRRQWSVHREHLPLAEPGNRTQECLEEAVRRTWPLSACGRTRPAQR